jgi:hypothetical protein
LLHDLFKWLEEDLGKSSPDGLSWSQALHGSLNLWNVVEGTHVLAIMFFAGTIWIIDLRMLGLAFKKMSFSTLNNRILPITVAAFAFMLATGALAFFGRTPVAYYHDVWFRGKMLFLLLASINIFVFHYRIQKDEALWDSLENPPLKVRISGGISLTLWMLVIIFGRFIAYDWYHCDKVKPGTFVYAIQECKSALSYLNEAPPVETPTPEAAPATDSAAPPASPAAPSEPASAPVTPAPGKGG